MNLVRGSINLNSIDNNIIIDNNRFVNGIIDLYVERIHCTIYDKKNIFYNEKTNFLHSIIGYIANLEAIKKKYAIDEKYDVEVIEKFYRLKGIDFIYELDGVFTILICDLNNKNVYIFQDEYGSNLPLYYNKTQNQFHFSSSLKEILKNVIFERKLNVNAAVNFLFYRTVIPDESTLIENIYKLIPGHFIIVNYGNNSIEICPLKVEKKKISKKVAKNKLIESINISINELAKMSASKYLCTTLSGGFDTNYILYNIAKNATKQIVAITIGGKHVNEIPAAQKCANQYLNVTHKYKLLSPNSLNFLPDIVWKLDGYVFQEGIFLQYELANLIRENNIQSIFLGDCADQQLNSYRHIFSPVVVIKYRLLIKRTILGDLYYKFKEHKSIKYSKRIRILKLFKATISKIKFDTNIDYILRKNGLMLNSNNIQGFYPYLNKEMKMFAMSIGLENRRKKYYKKEVSKILSNEKSINPTKIGGTTDVDFLIEDNINIFHKLLNSEFIRDFLKNSQLTEISENLSDYYDFALQLLYIYLFNELFITGEFDYNFDKVDLNMTLDDFLN